MEALEQAAYEVEVYENHIDLLLSMHKECAEPVQWKKILSMPEPRQPLKSGALEQAALHASATYLPNFWARLFKLERRKREALLGRAGVAAAEDENCSRQSLMSGRLHTTIGLRSAILLCAF